MWIGSTLCAVLSAVILYRVYALITFLKFNDTIFNHEPGPCRFIAVTSSNCSNKHSDTQQCKVWAERGECQANRDWMREQCAQSCDYCQDPNQLLYGAEDIAHLGNGKVLLSTGLKPYPGAFPERQGRIYFWDFNKPFYGAVPVAMKDYPSDNINPHGITLWRNNQGKVTVFFVNHADVETVEQFEYKENTNTLHHIKSITHNDFYFLNSLQATGDHSFFYTNSAWFTNRSPFSAMESFLMLPTGSVGHYEAGDITAWSSGYNMANGVCTSVDNKYLYVSNMGAGTIETFEINEDHQLNPVNTLDLKVAVDNIAVDPLTGDLWVGGLAKPWAIISYMGDPENSTVMAPAQVLRVKTHDGIPSHEITEIYANDGSAMKLVTGAMTYKGLMLASSLYGKTLLCQILHV